jgi:hypothetical protein
MRLLSYPTTDRLPGMVVPLARAAAISPAAQLVVEGGHGRGQGTNEEYSSRGLPVFFGEPTGDKSDLGVEPGGAHCVCVSTRLWRRRVCPDALVGYPTSRALGGMWVKPDW